MGFLPMTREEMRAQGIDQLDFVYVTGDAYIDHSSFGTAIIARVLEAFGYSVGIVAQPDWRDPESVAVLGEPRLGFLVSSGNMDSMVNHYTSNKRQPLHRRVLPGRPRGAAPRPRGDRLREPRPQALPRRPHRHRRHRGLPAPPRPLRLLERLHHAGRSCSTANADLLVYGMGERAIREVADALAAGIDVRDITFVRGTVYRARDLLGDRRPTCVELASYRPRAARATASPTRRSFAAQYRNMDPITAKHARRTLRGTPVRRPEPALRNR